VLPRLLPKAMALPDDPLLAIQVHFHALIAKRSGEFGCALPGELRRLQDLSDGTEPNGSPSQGCTAVSVIESPATARMRS
jgi:hypothetical protein